jgi:hypothetical protein
MHDRSRWDSGLMRPVAEINELMLETLRAAAAAPANDAACTPAPRLVSALRTGWCSLDAAALQRLAHCPYVLLDAGFAAPTRWDALAIAGSPHGAVMDGGALRGYFAGSAGVALLRRTLSFAWHLARSNQLGARIMLGMTGECAERIGSSALKQLEALAELGPAWIAPRWESQPIVWGQMIQAAVDGSDAALRRAQQRGLQLMAALW